MIYPLLNLECNKHKKIAPTFTYEYFILSSGFEKTADKCTPLSDIRKASFIYSGAL